MSGIPDDSGPQLSALDYLAYTSELHGQSRTSYMSIEVLDGVASWETLRDDFERATRLVPRMRQRVVSPVLPMLSAQWVTDPDFSLDYHLRRMSLPAPGTLRELLDLAQTMHATPLDLDRPLWEATLVEGLDQGSAIILKLGQPLYDGVSELLMDGLLHADEDRPDRGAMPPLPVPHDLSPVDLTRSDIRNLPRTLPRRVAQDAGGTLRKVRAALRDPLAAARDVAGLASDLGSLNAQSDIDPSPLLRRRSLRRRFETLEVDLAPLRAAAAATDCSVHEACVAAVCGGLRLYHEVLGVPVESLPLGMPLDVRFDDEPAGGDPWTGIRLAAPIGVPNARARMRLLHSAILAAEPEPAVRLLRSVAPVVSWLPSPVLGALGHLGRDVDVHVASVRGQPGQVYVGGVPLARIIPIGPLLGGAMSVLFALADSTCHVGVNLDPVAVPDPDEFLRCLSQGFDEVAAVRTAPAPRARRTTPKASPTPKAMS